MANSADPDQMASLKANWSGSALIIKTGYLGSAGLGLRQQHISMTLGLIQNNLKTKVLICYGKDTYQTVPQKSSQYTIFTLHIQTSMPKQSV